MEIQKRANSIPVAINYFNFHHPLKLFTQCGILTALHNNVNLSKTCIYKQFNAIYNLISSAKI